MRILTVAVVVAGLVGASARVQAEDIVAYQADGDADAGAVNAKVDALDEAFGKAVSQALNDLLEPDVRKQNKPVLDRELLGHARLWVTGYKVSKETVTDDRKQLSVSVRVDRDKVRARLAELNISTKGAGEAPAPNAQTVTILLRVVTPDGVHATYGFATEKDVAGLAALSGALRRANLVIKRAPASGPPAKAGGELPVDDETAEAFASEARADLAAIAGITVGAPVPIRGVAARGVLIAAHVRLVDRKAHKALGQGTAIVASRGTDPGIVGYTIDRAVVSAMADVLSQPAQNLAQAQTFSDDDQPIGEPGIVLVRLGRSTPWGMVQSEIKHLIGARGVSRATLRHVSPAGWVIGVATTDSIDRIASIVKKPPATDTAVTVKIIGNLVEATLSEAP